MERKKVCILGTAPTCTQAPFEDESWDMWAISSLPGRPDIKRVDRVFEMHPWWEIRSMLGLLMKLEELKVPIYLQEVSEEIPHSVKYPYDEIKKKFHLDVMGDNLYVTNTITWMILLAIHEGYQDIGLFGVHMAHESEYAYQRSSCSWALGIIHGMILSGAPLTLHIPEESELLKANYEYGYGQPTKLMIQIDARRKGLESGVADVDSQMERLMQSRWRTEGAMQECSHWYNMIMGYK